MKAATCKQCGRHALVPIDAHEAEEALAHINVGLFITTRLECVYCGGQQSTRDAEEILHASCEESEISKRVARETEKESAKVERLKEGRW